MVHETGKKKRRTGLGKGLGALIPANSAEKREYMLCAVESIRPAPNQPRKTFDEASLAELAQSIRQSGLIQPLVVRQVAGGAYELIAGERRWRACQKAGVREVPVVIKDIDDDNAFVLALVENIQREDLNPVEEALAYKRLLDEYDHTQQAVAERVGKSRSAVANSLRLLGLPERVKSMVTDGQLSAGHARSLVTLDAEEALELAEIMVLHGYSVREAEEMVRESKEAAAPEVEAPKAKPAVSKYRDDEHVRDIAERLQEALGTRVMVKDRNGHGRIEIHYADYDVLQDVIERLITE